MPEQRDSKESMDACGLFGPKSFFSFFSPSVDRSVPSFLCGIPSPFVSTPISHSTAFSLKNLQKSNAEQRAK
jgi:hypothetical protein